MTKAPRPLQHFGIESLNKTHTHTLPALTARIRRCGLPPADQEEEQEIGDIHEAQVGVPEGVLCVKAFSRGRRSRVNFPSKRVVSFLIVLFHRTLYLAFALYPSHGANAGRGSCTRSDRSRRRRTSSSRRDVRSPRTTRVRWPIRTQIIQVPRWLGERIGKRTGELGTLRPELGWAAVTCGLHVPSR